MTSEVEVQEWSESYQKCMDNPPSDGAILKAIGDDKARLNVELQQGKVPFIYGCAYVPCVVGEAVGWFLQSYETNSNHGWKCILLSKARDECIRRFGLNRTRIPVKSLKVVQKSQSGNSLLCEVHEFCDDEE